MKFHKYLLKKISSYKTPQSRKKSVNQYYKIYLNKHLRIYKVALNQKIQKLKNNTKKKKKKKKKKKGQGKMKEI